MNGFNKLGICSKTLKLKVLNTGIYNLISLRKIQTKYGDAYIANLMLTIKDKTIFLKNVMEIYLRK